MAEGKLETSDESRVTSSVRKLVSEDQWETWKWQIELCLKEQCLYSVVDGTRKCPAAPTGEEEPSDAYRRWQRDNARAARIIGTALDEEPSIYVRRKTDAKDIWDTLISVFEQSSLQRLYTLFDNFFEFSKDEATSVTKHTSQLANIFDDLISELKKSNPNATLPLSLLHHRIFRTLGPEYQYYRSTWYRVPEAEQTTRLLVENLRAIESSLVAHGTSQTAGAFYANSRQRKQQRQFSKSSTPGTSTSKIVPSSSSKKKETRSCLYCKKVGHIISNCRKRIAAEQRASAENATSNTPSFGSKISSKPSSFYAVDPNTDAITADSWISDSGTTNHISANKQHFATFEKFPIPQRIQTAGDGFILAYGSGSINIDVCIRN
jgi:hypothetical protein